MNQDMLDMVTNQTVVNMKMSFVSMDHMVDGSTICHEWETVEDWRDRLASDQNASIEWSVFYRKSSGFLLYTHHRH